MKRMLFAGLMALALTGLVAPAGAQDQPKREITNIAGDLYIFRNNFHNAVFLVTADGIITTDPINAEAATWLKAELASRFGKPVTHVIYSHEHPDHASGGEVFADTAVFIGHENTRRVMIAESRPTPPPTVVFSDRMTIHHGGKSVVLSYVGRNHSDNSIVMHFEQADVLFAVDFIPVKALAYQTLHEAYFPDWYESLERVETMDFAILAPGHGMLGTKQDVTNFRVYLETLRDEVMTQIRAGKNLAEIQASVTLDAYKDWSAYDMWREMNIEGMYNHIRNHRRGNPS